MTWLKNQSVLKRDKHRTDYISTLQYKLKHFCILQFLPIYNIPKLYKDCVTDKLLYVDKNNCYREVFAQ